MFLELFWKISMSSTYVYGNIREYYQIILLVGIRMHCNLNWTFGHLLLNYGRRHRRKDLANESFAEGERWMSWNTDILTCFLVIMNPAFIKKNHKIFVQFYTIKWSAWYSAGLSYSWVIRKMVVPKQIIIFFHNCQIYVNKVCVFQIINYENRHRIILLIFVDLIKYWCEIWKKGKMNCMTEFRQVQLLCFSTFTHNVQSDLKGCLYISHI
jgi:hypothetical protein